MNTLSFLKTSLNIVSVLSVIGVFLLPSMASLLWSISLLAVFILMTIRPLHDLFPHAGFIQYISLRKQLGILSSLIVVCFGIQHYIALGPEFLTTYFSWAYWSFTNNLFWAHLGELTGVILLATSNKLSMRLLKRNWKRVQRLSYVYFFSGAWYVFAAFGKTFGFIAIIIVFELTLFAYMKKRYEHKLLQGGSYGTNL